MTKNKWKIILLLLILAFGVYIYLKMKQKNDSAGTYKEVTVVYGDIQKAIAATAVVQPQNRLEMKPPVSGRLDKILVVEGQKVKTGETVAFMSSTERAALMDAANSQSDEEKAYWQDVYKPIPLIAPIDGEVIVKTVQPGQTVTQADVVIVLSDRLIVQAQVDETDIGKIKEGQEAVITLDAYPDVEAKASVAHIYHESKVVNNVTIYQVDILPETVPAVFRSGMSANVKIIEESRKHILLAPLETVKRGKEGNFVLMGLGKGKKPKKNKVETGISDESNVEIISGLKENDVLAIPVQKSASSKGAKPSTNPFMPGGGQRKKQ